jgi:hypothetical protein
MSSCIKRRIFNKLHIRKNVKEGFTDLEDMKKYGTGKKLNIFNSELGQCSVANFWEGHDWVILDGIPDPSTHCFVSDEEQTFQETCGNGVCVYIQVQCPILLDIRKVS